MATRLEMFPGDAEIDAAVAYPQYLKVNGRPALAFDAATDETCYWTRIVPQGWTGTITAVITIAMASATTNAVGIQVAVEAVTDGDATDLDATTSFDTVNNSSSTTVPGTAGYPKQITITLTNADSAAAADYIRIRLNRDADGSAITDNASGDMYFFGMEIRDAA